MHLTVSIPVMTDKLSPKKLEILSQIGAREYILIKEFINVIQADQQSDQPQLFQPKVSSKSMRDQLTLPSKNRQIVPFDSRYNKTGHSFYDLEAFVNV